jgi:glycosyltransferase involved in cell wall biosynthesis
MNVHANTWRPRISVAICTYNGEHFISEQLHSILDQTTSPDEIVLSDDGSKDQTIHIANEILTKQGIVKNWRIIRNTQNLGYVRNFEQACKACTGSLIFLSDQDDVWVKSKIDDFLPVFEDPSVLLAFSDGWVTDANLNVVTSLFSAFSITASDLDKINNGAGFSLFLKRTYATGAATAMRSSLLDMATPFPSSSWHHDEWLAFSAATANGIFALPKKTFYYRQHGRNQIGVPGSSTIVSVSIVKESALLKRFKGAISGDFARQCSQRADTLNRTLDRYKSVQIAHPELQYHMDSIRAEAAFCRLRGQARSITWLSKLLSYKQVYSAHLDHPWLAMALDAISAITSDIRSLIRKP